MMLEVLVAAVLAAGGEPGLRAGDEAPAFSAPSTRGPVSLADFKGRWLVLYFYPKAFTPGCTAESCSLRDGYADLAGTGATVLGVSLDELDVVRKFKAEHRLPFDLVSDTGKEVSRAYGVLGMGGLFALRRTFIIGPDGRIAAVIAKVEPARHAAQVAAALARLTGGGAPAGGPEAPPPPRPGGGRPPAGG